jgi:hypothetical protein
MSPLIQSYIASLIRAAILAFGGWLVKNHVDQSEADTLTAMLDPTALAGFAMAAGSVIWSIIHKNSVNTALVVAAATGKTTATVTPGASMAAAHALTPSPSPGAPRLDPPSNPT